jgi:hypothetical protein
VSEHTPEEMATGIASYMLTRNTPWSADEAALREIVAEAVRLLTTEASWETALVIERLNPAAISEVARVREQVTAIARLTTRVEHLIKERDDWHRVANDTELELGQKLAERDLRLDIERALSGSANSPATAIPDELLRGGCSQFADVEAHPGVCCHCGNDESLCSDRAASTPEHAEDAP